MNVTRVKYNNLLLISGTGRKTGKTSFACQLIRKNLDLNIVAIKISCHFHLQQNASPFLEVPGKYQIFIEKNAGIRRDSSRLLAAGAFKVFYIQTDREYVYEAFLKVLSVLPKNVPILCESDGLGKYLSPGLRIVIQRATPLQSDKIITYQPDYFNELKVKDFTIPPSNFRYLSGKWVFQKTEINII